MPHWSLIARTGYLAALMLVGAAPAVADTPSGATSSAVAYVGDPAQWNGSDVFAFVVSPWDPQQKSSGATTATSSNSGFFGGRGVSSYASSSLIDGTLKASAYADALLFPLNNGLRGFAAGSASMSDRFVVGATNAGAFSWGPDSQAHFTILLDGTNFSNTAAAQSFFDLTLSVQSLTTRRWGEAHLYGDDPSLAGGSLISSDPLPITMSWQRDSLTGNYRVTANFNPMGDFDWTLSLSAFVRVDAVGEVAYSDYSHTARVSYAGPDDSVTYSASGLFPGTAAIAAVPEPSTWMLTLAGLITCGMLARRRSVI